MPIADKTLTVGIPSHWGANVPPLQHSLYGAIVLDNQFESLVRRGKNGLIEPLGAVSWEISPDYRVIWFKIDTERRFSDGSPLVAADFKRSWEDGLRMAPKSANKSVMDALFTVKGFQDFNKKGTIPGVRVLSDDALEIEFEKPMRTALEYLGGVRYAAYKLVDGRPIGTGPSIMTETDGILSLTPNPHYRGEGQRFQMVRIMALEPQAITQKLKLGEIDATLVADAASLAECRDGASGKIQCAFGQEGIHVVVLVNGLSGRLFSDRNHRLALQALIHDHLKNSGRPQELTAQRITQDPQSFLPFQAGRLSSDEADEIIRQGLKHIPGLIEASQKSPVYLAFARDCQWLVSLLQSAGVVLAENSGKADFPRYLEMIYKTYEPDLIFGGFSVYDADPDGLYHKLGRKGAIYSPISDREGISDLLEEGRKIIDRGQLAPHYEKVAMAIMQEIPYVHIGYDYKTIAYNSDRVRVSETFLNRNNHRITIFEPK